MTSERNIQRSVLPNGLTILTERMEHVRSVSMGVWVKTGSRNEQPEVNGVSHFIEHMVFKGTKSRSAQRIAREVDSIGGNLDAFTGKETTCFNIKVLDEHMGSALDVLSDLVLNPTFTSEDILRERGVVLEEIKVDEDNPDYLVHEIFVQNFWKDHPLGKPILGTRETVKKFQQSTLFDYYGGRFFGGNIVFSAAGNLDHAKFVDMVSEKFAGLQAGQDDWASGAAPKTRAKIIMRNKKALEQVQICIGVPAPPIAAEDRYTSYILNSILGGGMSSRLFQVVREEHGLAYSIFSELNPYRDTGSLCVYAGTSIDKASRVVDLIVTEFGRMKKEAISAEELRRAQDQIKGNMVLGLESSSARMSNLARQEMYFEQFFGTDEILEKIEQVTIESVQEMATQIFRPEAVALTVLGNLKDLKITRDQLAC